jgi:hypothetical protein
MSKSQVVRTIGKYACVDRWHVHDGAVVYPGKKIVDVTGEDGTTSTHDSNTWGVVIISDRSSKAGFDDTDPSLLQVDNDNEQRVSYKPSARLADSWGIAAYTSGFTSIYKGPDEISAEKHYKSKVYCSDPEYCAVKVYGEGDYICQIIAVSPQGTVRTATPHPSTSTSISRAKAEGRLLPTFG